MRFCKEPGGSIDIEAENWIKSLEFCWTLMFINIEESSSDMLRHCIEAKLWVFWLVVFLLWIICIIELLPSFPGLPCIPCVPCSPCGPDIPCSPCGPAGPTFPWEPSEPSFPGDPASPCGPGFAEKRNCCPSNEPQQYAGDEKYWKSYFLFQFLSSLEHKSAFSNLNKHYCIFVQQKYRSAWSSTSALRAGDGNCIPCKWRSLPQTLILSLFFLFCEPLGFAL